MMGLRFRRGFDVFAMPLLVVGVVAGAEPTGGLRPPLANSDTAALSLQVRTLLLKHLPDPLVQSSPGWGKQKETTIGVKYHRDGLKLSTELIKGQRNDGTWRRMSVRAVNVDQSLALALQDVVTPEPGRVTFTAMIGVDCDLKFEQQIWKTGTRLYSGETRGRCKGALLLKCEATNRLEPRPNSFVPDLVLRLRVTEAQLFYEKLVIEHTAGIGGDAAKLLGEALISTIRQVKPQLERDLLAKANAAIVKAGDTKEVRVELGKLLEGKAPTITKTK